MDENFVKFLANVKQLMLRLDKKWQIKTEGKTHYNLQNLLKITKVCLKNTKNC